MIGRRGFLSMVGGASLLSGNRLFAQAGMVEEQLEAAVEFLHGRTVRVIIAAGAGSGTDRSSRQFLAGLLKLLPQTRLRVENIDRAGGQIAASELWRASRDGSVIGFPRSNLFYAELLERQTLDFSFPRFTFFGSMTQAHRVMVLRNESRVTDLYDVLSGTKIVLKSADSVTSSHYYEAVLLNALTGSRIRPVPGFSGGARNMAVISGEVDCQIGSIEAVQPILDSGVGRLMLRLSSSPLPEGFPEVPSLLDHLRAPELAWAVGLIDAAAALGRPIAGPPDMTPEAAAHWSTLFQAVMADEEFRATSREVDGLIIDPTGGAEITKLLADLSAKGAGLQSDIDALLMCGQLLSTSLTSSCA